MPFDYATAFCRNAGVLRVSEQSRLRETTIALAGLGGAGGAHLQALLRMGVGAFHLADLDRFELANFNRQWGATMETVGRPKVECMAELARHVNPEVKLQLFPEGVTPATAGAFLEGVDVAVDAIDFFNLDARRLLMTECRRRATPVLLAAPVGFGASVLLFPPTGPTFDEHLGLRDGMTRIEQLMAFALALGFGLTEDVDLSRSDPLRGKGPAVGPACLLAASLVSVELVKLMRDPFPPAPAGMFLDPMRGRAVPLRRVPALRDSEEGLKLRSAFFSRFPGLEALHRQELVV